MQKKMRISSITNINDGEFTITRVIVDISDTRVKLEIYSCEKQSRVLAKFYLTGSKYFTICVRGIFSKMGLTLNQKFIKSQSQKYYYPKTEEEIFAMLRCAYLPPMLR
jgi:DNA polymerase/3'-5' exonuclease PolX